MGFSFRDENSLIEAAESLCFGPANTGSTSNFDQENEDHLQLVEIELHDDCDIQMVYRSEAEREQYDIRHVVTQ